MFSSCKLLLYLFGGGQYTSLDSLDPSFVGQIPRLGSGLANDGLHWLGRRSEIGLGIFFFNTVLRCIKTMCLTIRTSRIDEAH